MLRFLHTAILTNYGISFDDNNLVFNDRQPDVPGNFSDDLPTHHLYNACFRSSHSPQWCKTTAVVIHKPSRADRCRETAYTTERSRSLSALPSVHSARKFDVHGLATDAGAYDQNFQIVPYSSRPAGEISTVTNVRRLLEKMAALGALRCAKNRSMQI
jgi:hypothetical protein